jgi:integral membrane protein (TIGR01906 family)
MDGTGAHPGGGIAPARQPRGWLGWLLPPATALVIIVAAVLLLATPIWMQAALNSVSGVPGGNPARNDLSDRTVAQLVFGGSFEIVLPDGSTLYTPDEIAHLRDARSVLYVFVALAAAALVLVVAALVHRPNDARRWRAVARGGAGLLVGTVIVGVVAFLAFDAAFELFHRVFFPGGNWAFPADSNMIRLYPYAFWQLTAAALGVLCVVGGGVVWWFVRWRASRLAA